jgi:hypothetical protein
MDIDHRKLRARHLMLRHDQLRLGLVVADRRRRELRLPALRGPGALREHEWRCQGDGKQREWQTIHINRKPM